MAYLDLNGLSHFWNNIKDDIGTASDEQVADWLDAHPEATTTVQDGVVTTPKLADGAVTDAKLAQSGGILDSVTEIKDILDYGTFSDNTQVTPASTMNNAYINQDGVLKSIVSDSYGVKVYKVLAGLSYKLYGTASLNANGLVMAAYSAGSQATIEDTLDTSLIVGTTTNTDYNVDYEPQQDGYLYVAYFTGRSQLSVMRTSKFDSVRIRDCEESATIVSKAIEYVEKATDNYSVVDGLYIAADGEIRTAGDVFKIYYLPVAQGNVVRVTYASYSLLGDFGAVSFSSSVPAASGTSTVLVSGSTTVQDIDYTYEASSEGYLLVANNQGNQSAVPTYYRGGYELNGLTDKTPLKVQLFGDSITDDYWGDNRTWGTILQNYMTEYDLTVINSAVGGSGWCWGKSTGGRYPDKEHNYVNALLHDGTLDITADVVVILAGTNNWAGSYPPIGSFGNKPTFTPDTYYPVSGANIYAAIYNAIEIISTTTDALLILVTPPQRYNSADQSREVDQYGAPVNGLDNTLRDLCDAIVTSARFYGVPCLDLNAELGWNRMNVGDFTTDGLHPNDAGDEMIAKIIADEIKRHC